MTSKERAAWRAKANGLEAIFQIGKEGISDNLIAQLTAPVRWTQSVQNMIADGADHFIELGPGAVLQGLVKKINKEVTTEGMQ